MTNDGNPADIAQALERDSAYGAAFHECVVIPIRQGIRKAPATSTIIQALERSGVTPTDRELVFIEMIEKQREQIRLLKKAVEG